MERAPRLIYLDTHVVLWLFENNLSYISKKALHLIEEQDCYISPILLLEMQYLWEIKRIKFTPQHIYNNLEKLISLKTRSFDLQKIIQQTMHMTWTRDLFDRLIVAQAQLENAHLITKDKMILKNYKYSVWD